MGQAILSTDIFPLLDHDGCAEEVPRTERSISKRNNYLSVEEVFLSSRSDRLNGVGFEPCCFGTEPCSDCIQPCDACTTPATEPDGWGCEPTHECSVAETSAAEPRYHQFASREFGCEPTCSIGLGCEPSCLSDAD
jgi:hypothetical protein